MAKKRHPQDVETLDSTTRRSARTSRPPSTSPSSRHGGPGAAASRATRATPTSIRSSSGAARTSRTGATSSSRRRRSTSRRRCTRRCSSTTCSGSRRSAQARSQAAQIDLFADFNGVAEGADKTDFYQHDQNWSNRMILGDSLQVMASLAEREGLRGKVQCIYIDPPYGIKFNSNFQWSTTSRDVKDGNAAHITREPEQVKAFRDTWRDGIHSYLTYLRDRLTVARDLLTDSGSIFVQIGDENVHRVRALMDEVFGEENFCRQISFQKTTGQSCRASARCNRLRALWYAKDRDATEVSAGVHCKKVAVESDTERSDTLETSDWSSTRLTEAEIAGIRFRDGDESISTSDNLRLSAARRAFPSLLSQGRPSPRRGLLENRRNEDSAFAARRTSLSWQQRLFATRGSSTISRLPTSRNLGRHAAVAASRSTRFTLSRLMRESSSAAS